MKWLIIPGLVGLLTLGACSSEVTPVLGCAAGERLTPVCGFQNPEDMAPIPGSEWLIVSEFGGMGPIVPGRLSLFHPDTETREVVFPGSASLSGGWGDPSCPAPGEEFAPHGIDLAETAEGLRLLVVNHGLRESIEMFSLQVTDGSPRLQWRGCVLAPPDAFFNDLVNLADGGLLVTHMMSRSTQQWQTMLSVAGFDTGYVMSWSPEQGFSKVPGTDAPFPNGIEISDDEQIMYVNMYMANEVRKINRADGRLLGTAAVAQPDNITWGVGELLVASHVDGISELLACNELVEGACGFAFEIVALDPDSMEQRTVFAHRGAPMGGATVALPVGERIYIGSFAGDRVAYFQVRP